MNCENCGIEFEGRPNRSTCSNKCRRDLEHRRRRWDRLAEVADSYLVRSVADPLIPVTPKQKAEWLAARAEIIAQMGLRP